MDGNYTVYNYLGVPQLFRVELRPYARKVSQKERRRKERRLRSNGIKVRGK